MMGLCPVCESVSGRAPMWPYCSGDCRATDTKGVRSKPRLRGGRDPAELRAEAVEENKRINRMLGNSTDEGAQPIPPDGPVEDEKHYDVLLWRRLPWLHRLIRKNPKAIDLNNVPLPVRVEQIGTYMLLHDAAIPLGILQHYEGKLKALKTLLRSTWGPDIGPYQKAQADVLKLKARVSRIYKARHWNRT